MDRRQKKTRESIFRALNKLLETNKYSSITVQQIIDEANIGRSTFYSHFETKDELLKTMCTDIFNHIFSNNLKQEQSHDFSAQAIGIKPKLTHLLYHIKDNKKEIKGILCCESGELFMKYLKEYLNDMFTDFVNCLDVKVPKRFVIHHMAVGFAENIRWWVTENIDYTPEEMTDYFMDILDIGD